MIISLLYLSSSFAQERYKLGAVLDLTGPTSFLGVPEKNGITMLLDEINTDMGGIHGRPLEVIIYDSEGDESKGILAFKKLINEDKVIGLLGPTRSGTSLSAIPFIEKAGVPNISYASSAKIVKPVKKWVFKSVQEDYFSWKAVYEYLKKQGITKIAALTAASGYGESGRRAIEALFPAGGIEITRSEKFGARDTDMTAQLTRIMQTNAQAILVNGATPSASIVTKNVRQLGIKIPLVQGPAYDVNFIKLEGDAANGVIFVCARMIAAEILPLDDPQKQVLLRFKEQYRRRFNADPNVFAGLAWDGLALMANALDKAGPNKAKVRDAIENTRGFALTQGTYNMSKTDHAGLDANIVMQVVDPKTYKIKILHTPKR